MVLKNYVSVDVAEIVPENSVVNPSTRLPDSEALHFEWGSARTTNIIASHFRCIRFEARLKENLHVRNYSENKASTVDSCFVLSGSIDSSFYGVQSIQQLKTGYNNFIYRPVHFENHYMAKSESSTSVIHFSVQRDFYANLLDDHEKWSSQLKHKLLGNCIVCGPNPAIEITPAMYGAIHNIVNSPFRGSMQNIFLESKILELIAYQLQSAAKQEHQKVQKLSGTDRDRFFALREHLAQNFHLDHSLKSLSRDFGVNEFKLKKGFKELFGTTVFDYIHDLKMNHARKMLQAERLYVNEVASHLGYKNPNHFSAAFKKKFGVCPKDFR